MAAVTEVPFCVIKVSKRYLVDHYLYIYIYIYIYETEVPYEDCVMYMKVMGTKRI